MLRPTVEIERARAKWRYRGHDLPDFAEPAGPGEESVWCFPRPPVIEAVADLLRVVHQDAIVAETLTGVRILETAGAPTYYFPPVDVDEALLERTAGESLCEWKGIANSYRIGRQSPAAWCYRDTFPEFESIRGWYGFYPAKLICHIGDEQAQPQPGGYYGGWVTSHLKGPIKGGPGTDHW